MFMIELYNTTTSYSLVLDTGCGSHICTVLHGLKESRRLRHGELNLVMGNKKITHVTRIGKYELKLKSGDNVVFVARRGVFLEREMISKEDSGSKIDLEEIQESADEEPIRTRLVKISESTLSELDETANYKEAMASPDAAK
ncbi:hypothetical protein Tco_0328457 [Tanacetum coccineum]